MLNPDHETHELLKAEIVALKARLEDAEEASRAIGQGEVDALIADVSGGPQLFVLQSSDVESNRFHSEILAKVSDSVIALDVDDHVTYLNSAAERQYGIVASEVLGKHSSAIFQNHWHGESDDLRAGNSLKAEGFWRGESLHLKLDGTPVHVESAVSRILDPDGSPGGYLHVIRDISLRRSSERALRDSEERYRTLFNSIDEGFCIVEVIHDVAGMPVDYRFLHVSPSFAQQSGMGEVVGRTMREIAPLHEEHWFEYYGKVARTGESVRFQDHARELGRWFDVYASRFGEPENNQVAIVFNDITLRKRAEEQVRRNEILFSTIIDQAPGGVYVADDELNTLQVSQRVRPIFKAAEPLIGRSVLDVMTGLWGGEAGEYIASIFRHTLDSGERFVAPRFTNTREDLGEVQSYEWITQRIILPTGAFGVVCYFSDVTEQHKLENTLRAHAEVLAVADRRKDEFLAMLAHELRNPLAPILPGVEVMLSASDRPEIVLKVGQMIRRQTEQMSRLIEDLLDMSRVTTGKIELRKTRVTLGDVLERAVEQVTPLVEKMRHQLTVDPSFDDAVLEADPHRLAQVISNLLSNAAKYTPEGGRIGLSIREGADSTLCVSVTDNGKGISLDHQSNIFDLFDQGTSGPADGLGIGLTLVKSLVEMHGGTVSVRSEGEGRGSEFTVTLPYDPGLSLASRPSVDGELPPKHAKLRVLVADDAKNTADILAMFFRLEGMEAMVGYDGQQAIDAAETFRPDLVCLDLGMPIVDGFEAAIQIRKMNKAVRLIALSGWGSPEDRKRTAAAGFDKHLTKPVKPEDLRELMRELFPLLGQS